VTALLTDCPVEDVERRTVRGVSWVGGGQIVRQVVQGGLFVLLARILTPDAFGVMALVIVITGFAAVLGEMGIEATLVRRSALSPSDLSSMFWALLLLNAVLAGVLIAGAGAAAAVLHSPTLVTPLRVSAVIFPLTALSIVPRAFCSRALHFRPVTLAETTAVLLGGVSAITVGILGGGVWALVVLELVTAGCTAVLLFAFSGWRPSLVYRHSSVASGWRFARGIVGFNVVNYWARNADNLLIGRVLGAVALGLYERAYMTMLLPVTQLAQMLGRVLMSSLSRLGDDLAAIRELYLRTIALIALLVTPLMWGVSVLAGPFVATVFGSQWADAVPTLRVLTIAAPLQAIVTTVGWIYQSRGRSGLYFRVGLLSGVAIVASIVVGVALGSIVVVAICYAVTTAGLLFLPTMAISGRLIGVRIRDVLGAIGPSFLAAGAAAAVMILVDHELSSHSSLARLLIGAAVGCVVYLTVLMRMGSAALHQLLELLPSRPRSTTVPPSLLEPTI
jgi:O-antigen/teichoic acid export membrane protein